MNRSTSRASRSGTDTYWCLAPTSVIAQDRPGIPVDLAAAAVVLTYVPWIAFVDESRATTPVSLSNR